MPCSVKINQVYGVVPTSPEARGKPALIRVSGIAIGCQKVLVNSDCSDPDGITVWVIYQKEQEEGNWTAELNVIEGSGCECGSEVRVRAIASPYNPECQGVSIQNEKLTCFEE